MNTDAHRFLRQIGEDFSNEFSSIKSFDLSGFICVHLCKSVAKNSYFRAFSCLFVAKKLNES